MQQTTKNKSGSLYLVTDSVIIDRSVFMFRFSLLSHEIDKAEQVFTAKHTNNCLTQTKSTQYRAISP